jgi:hypothetical protein
MQLGLVLACSGSERQSEMLVADDLLEMCISKLSTSNIARSIMAPTFSEETSI